jgi:hypothetical protein
MPGETRGFKDPVSADLTAGLHSSSNYRSIGWSADQNKDGTPTHITWTTNQNNQTESFSGIGNAKLKTTPVVILKQSKASVDVCHWFRMPPTALL